MTTMSAEEMEQKLRLIVADCDSQIEAWSQLFAGYFEQIEKEYQEAGGSYRRNYWPTTKDEKIQSLVQQVEGLNEERRIAMLTDGISIPQRFRARLLKEFPFLASEAPKEVL